MEKVKRKEVIIKENPYIRTAYIIFSETYNFTKTSQYSKDVRKILEELIKLLYKHLKYPNISDYEIVDETFSRKVTYQFDGGANHDCKRI